MIKAILVDDERLALAKLSGLLKGSGLVDVLGSYEHPTDALEAEAIGSVDVVFLDIEMPEMSGFVLADRILQMNSEVSVVFVTAYNEYAVEAFELNAIDYLLKPVKKERLLNTLERVMKHPRLPNQQTLLRVYCFGEFRVEAEGDGKEKINWRTSKAEKLFAFLIHHMGQSVSRDQVIEAIWDDLAPEKAVTHFHTTMYYVRKALSNIGIKGLIHQDKGFYQINADKIYCDYYEFERLSRISTPMSEENVPALKNCVRMYRGEYLSQHSYPWADAVRNNLDRRYVELLMRLHEYYLKEEDFRSCEEMLQRALKCDPLNERVHEQLIQVYLLMNDRLAAMKQYDILRRKLKTDYGLEPGNDVKRLLGVK